MIRKKIVGIPVSASDEIHGHRKPAFVVCLFVLIVTIHSSLFAAANNLLRDARYYTKNAFTPADLSAEPDFQSWQLFLFQDKNVRISFSEQDAQSAADGMNDYSVAVTFLCSLSQLEMSNAWLTLSSIGQNYEIYLNGRIVHREIYTDRNGQIIADRSAQNLSFFLPARFFRNGRNTLLFHIVGDANRRQNGLINPQIVLLREGSAPSASVNNGVFFLALGLSFLFFSVPLIAFCRRRELFVSLIFVLCACGLMAVRRYGTVVFFDARSAQNAVLLMQGAIAVISVSLFELHSLRRSSLPALITALGVVIICAFSYSYPDAVMTAAENFLMPFVLACTMSVYITLFNIPLGKTAFSLGRLFSIYALATLAYYIFPLWGLNGDWAVLLLSCVSFVVVFSEHLHALMQQQSARLISEANFGDAQRELSAARNDLKEALVRIDRLMEKSNHYEEEYKKYRDTFFKDSYITGVVQDYAFSKYAPSDECYDIAMYNSCQGKVSQILYDFYGHDEMVSGLSLFSVDATGISSGLITLFARNILFRRFNQYQNKKLSEIVAAANKDIADEIGRFNNPLTGAMLKFTDDGVEYISIGFPDCIYRNANRKTRSVRLVEREMPKTFGVSVPDETFPMIRFVLEKGDSLLLYTPSLSMNRSSDDQPFSRDMVISSFEQIPHFPNVIDEVNHFIKQYNTFIDPSAAADYAVIVIRKK